MALTKRKPEARRPKIRAIAGFCGHLASFYSLKLTGTDVKAG